MKVALINAPVLRPSPPARLSPPLGLAYVAAALAEAGHEVAIADYNLSGLDLPRVDRMMEVDRPQVVGIYARTETYPSALTIAARVKARSPETVVVLGGPHPTLLVREVLTQPSVDFVVIGEGEATMVDLLRSLESREADLFLMKGLGVKKEGLLKIGEPRELLDPDALPFPARDLLPLELYAEPWTVLTSRGACPFHCPFCAASSPSNGRRRARAPERVAAEVGTLAERYGAAHVFFADDVFTLDKRWVRRLLKELRALEAPVTWGCSTRADMVDDELLKEMAVAGCQTIQFGVESGAPEILESVKGIRKGQVVRAVEGALRHGIEVSTSFMLPFPDDTQATIRQTKGFMNLLKAKGCRILLGFTTPYPGTFFSQHAAELGLKVLAEGWEEYDAKHNVLCTRHLTAEEIERLAEEVVRDVGLVAAGC